MTDQIYDSHILRLNTPAGFDEWFFRACSDYKTNEEAYEAVERSHERYFGQRRYENYRSYYISRNARLKRKKDCTTL